MGCIFGRDAYKASRPAGFKLDKAQMGRVFRLWDNTLATSEEVMQKSLRQAMDRSIILRQTIVGDQQLAEEDLYNLILFVGNKFTEFLAVCVEYVKKYDWTNARLTALQLGARHTKYGGGYPFQPIFWDIFVLSMTEVLEEKSSQPTKDKKLIITQEDIALWQIFFRLVVDWMRRGYMDKEKEEKMNEDTEQLAE